jgi:hypothetical protein
MTQAKLDDKRRRAFAIAVRDGHLHQVGKCVSSRPGGVPLGGGPERTASLITRSSLIVVRRRYPCCGTRGIRHACAGRSGRLGVSQDFRPVETVRPERSGDRRRAADRHRPPRRGAAQGAAQPHPSRRAGCGGRVTSFKHGRRQGSRDAGTAVSPMLVLWPDCIVDCRGRICRGQSPGNGSSPRGNQLERQIVSCRDPAVTRQVVRVLVAKSGCSLRM